MKVLITHERSDSKIAQVLQQFESHRKIIVESELQKSVKSAQSEDMGDSAEKTPPSAKTTPAKASRRDFKQVIAQRSSIILSTLNKLCIFWISVVDGTVIVGGRANRI